MILYFITQASLKLELFIYVQNVAASGTILRATEGCVAAAATLINDRMRSFSATEQLDEASRAYWAVTQARQPENTTKPTFTQLRRIDDYQRAIDSATEDEAATSVI